MERLIVGFDGSCNDIIIKHDRVAIRSYLYKLVISNLIEHHLIGMLNVALVKFHDHLVKLLLHT